MKCRRQPKAFCEREPTDRPQPARFIHLEDGECPRGTHQLLCITPILTVRCENGRKGSLQEAFSHHRQSHACALALLRERPTRHVNSHTNAEEAYTQIRHYSPKYVDFRNYHEQRYQMISVLGPSGGFEYRSQTVSLVRNMIPCLEIAGNQVTD